MGNGAGRPRKTTASIKLAGTYRSDRRHSDEPVPDVLIPAKPAILKGPAAKEWYRITKELAAQKIISHMDMAACAGYCHAFGEVVKLDKEIAKQKKEILAMRKLFVEIRRRENCGDDQVISDKETKRMVGFGFSQKEVQSVTGAKKKASDNDKLIDSLFYMNHSAEYLVVGAKGGLILNPLVKARAAGWKMVLEFGREFGLSPVARTRISTGESKVNDEWGQFDKKDTG